MIGLTVITGGTWLIARRWWRRKPRHKTPWIIAAVLVYVLILVLGRFLP